MRLILSFSFSFLLMPAFSADFDSCHKLEPKECVRCCRLQATINSSKSARFKCEYIQRESKNTNKKVKYIKQLASNNKVDAKIVKSACWVSLGMSKLDQDKLAREDSIDIDSCFLGCKK